MGASSYAPSWRRFLHRHAPWLFVKCLGYNYHWRFGRMCYCMSGINGFGPMSLEESRRRRIEGRFVPWADPAALEDQPQ